jgi:flagellar biosynthesis protein FliP
MVTSTPGADGSQTYTLSVQTLLTLTALTFIPAVLLMMTSFTRIIIVLSLLRHALGTQTSPPNQVLLGLALFLTFFIMSPVLDSGLQRCLSAAVGRPHQLPSRPSSAAPCHCAVHAQADA